jgi:hypothetical protein
MLLTAGYDPCSSTRTLGDLEWLWHGQRGQARPRTAHRLSWYVNVQSLRSARPSWPPPPPEHTTSRRIECTNEL